MVNETRNAGKEVVNEVQKTEMNFKTDDRFEKLIPIAQEQFEAIERVALDRGEIFAPIFLWKEQNKVIDGYPSFKVLKSHPQLKHTLKEISFSSWQEAMHFVIEHNISRPSLNLWQKLELAFQCPDYWEIKAKAKQNQANTGTVQSESKIDSLQMIAETVGCGRTTVAHYQKVSKSSNTRIINACRSGTTSINAAYEKLFPGKKESNDPGNEKKQISTEVNTTESVFEDFESVAKVKKNNLPQVSDASIDTNPIAEKMKTQKVPDGALWMIVHKDQGVVQIVKKVKDKDQNIVHILVNSYQCELVEADEEKAIYRVNRINQNTAKILKEAV